MEIYLKKRRYSFILYIIHISKINFLNIFLTLNFCFRNFTLIRLSIQNIRLNYRTKKHIAGKNFMHAMSRQILRPNEIECNNRFVETLTGAQIRKMIREFALETFIEFRGSLYLSRRGINQGNSLSVKLTNIYLGSVERMLFAERPREVFCWRYIDDYLIYSKNSNDLLKVIFLLFSIKCSGIHWLFRLFIIFLILGGGKIL